MAPTYNDSSSSSPSSFTRPRANTSSVFSALTGRPRLPHTATTTTESSSNSSLHTATGLGNQTIGQPLMVDDLIQDLVSSEPSIGIARSLASALSTCSPLPQPKRLTPILIKLCGKGCPPQFQAAGYEILSAYWENVEAPHEELGTAERVTLFSLFEDKAFNWASDLWEARFKALRALTQDGINIIGMELDFLRCVTSWIEEVFNGWLTASKETCAPNDNPFHSPTVDSRDIPERERCIDVLAVFLANCLQRNDRLRDITQSRLLDFYVSLVTRSIDMAPPPSLHSVLTPRTERPPGHRQPHQRTISSISAVSSLPSSSVISTSSFFSASSWNGADPSRVKPPQEKAIQLYLDALQSQLKTLFPSSLNEIMPILFR